MLNIKKYLYSFVQSFTITDSNMETGLQLGSDLLQVGSQIMDLTWSNKDPSNKAVSKFESVIYQVGLNKRKANIRNLFYKALILLFIWVKVTIVLSVLIYWLSLALWLFLGMTILITIFFMFWIYTLPFLLILCLHSVNGLI